MLCLQTHSLQRLNSWGDAKLFYESTDKPRSSMWEDNERPLRDNRSVHIRLVKVGDEYHCVLHRTPVVQFVNEDLTIYRPYDSRSSRAFADVYLWRLGVSACTYKGQNALHDRYTDIYYRAANDIRITRVPTPPGAPSSVSRWRVDPTTPKCTKKVLDPHQLKENRALIKPFMQWVQMIYAMSGSDGSHPWEGKPVETDERRGFHHLLYANLTSTNPQDYEPVLLALLPHRTQPTPTPTNRFGWGWVYGSLDPSLIRSTLIKRLVPDINIPYDMNIKEWKE
jgi:hypothetical protein